MRKWTGDTDQKQHGDQDLCRAQDHELSAAAGTRPEVPGHGHGAPQQHHGREQSLETVLCEIEHAEDRASEEQRTDDVGFDSLLTAQRVLALGVQAQREIEDGRSGPRHDREDDVEHDQRREDRAPLGVVPRDRARDAIEDEQSDDHAPLAALAHAPRPKEKPEQHAVDRVRGLDRLDEAVACPLVLGIEPERFAKRASRGAELSVLELLPSQRRVRGRVLGIGRERFFQRAVRLVASPELVQGHRLDVEAVGVIGFVV